MKWFKAVMMTAVILAGSVALFSGCESNEVKSSDKKVGAACQQKASCCCVKTCDAKGKCQCKCEACKKTGGCKDCKCGCKCCQAKMCPCAKTCDAKGKCQCKCEACKKTGGCKDCKCKCPTCMPDKSKCGMKKDMSKCCKGNSTVTAAAKPTGGCCK